MINRKSILWVTASAAILFGMGACKKTDKQDNAAQNDQTEEVAAPLSDAQVDEMIVKYMNQLTPEPGMENRTDSLVTTPSGLKYRIVKEGQGQNPTAQNEVTVNYEGRLLDGNIFDSSYQRGEPTSFPLTQVIAGWTEGLQYMKPGAIYEFYIPYNLAYGDQERPGLPAKSDLLFKVELLEVK